MEQLKNIKIRNIRRFADDVNIDISEGATVFYAPNGTGKTSIFEAIELALTGAVKRLGKDLSPLIRDNCDEAYVRLDFHSGKYCEVTLSKDSAPVLTGNQTQLFPSTPFENVPYLLRLTHLLSQRAEGWFVQSQSTSAGEQLDYLSIGREATQANKVVISAKRASTLLRDSIARDVEDAKEDLSKWLSLLSKRDSLVNVDKLRRLRSSSDLFNQISSVNNQLNGAAFSFVDDLLLLKSQKNEVLALLNRVVENNKSLTISLSALRPTVDEYLRLTKSLLTIKRETLSLVEAKDRLDSTINRLKIRQSSASELLGLAEQAYNHALNRWEHCQYVFSLRAELDNTTWEVEDVKRSIDEANEKVKLAFIEYKKLSDLYSLHESFFKMSVALAEKKNSLSHQKSSLEKWKEYDKTIATLKGDIRPSLVADHNAKLDIVREFIKKKEKQQSLLEEAQRVFNSLNSAVDSIRSAVGIIVTNLPSDKGQCPVCEQVYEPTELRRRMDNALTSINPELQKSASKIDKLKSQINNISKDINDSNNEYIKASTLLKNVEDNIVLSVHNIEYIIANVFPGVSSLELAEKQLQDAINDNENAIATLERERVDTLPEPSVEQIAKLESRWEALETQKASHVNRLHSLTEQLTKLVNANDVEIIEVSLEYYEEISGKLEASALDVEKAKLNIAYIKKEIKEEQDVLYEAASNIVFSEKTILNITTTLSEYKAIWFSLQLKGEPNHNGLNQAIADCDTRAAKFQEYFDTLNYVDGEIARWGAYEEYLSIVSSIKTIKGDFIEAEYTVRLNNIKDELVDKLGLINEKIATLNSFANRLSHELDRVNELIKSINPIWNSLLKRIVVDPRFSDTSLDSYSHYKKQYADVNVNLHGKNTRVTHVASEAQITDLQLTFLLALAQHYKWMPWPALLLDDPTQHHDLVHASGVFDLLRDYIAEKKFQVMLATHDSAQARYFMRKLENDGIPGRLCTLHATADGVKAVFV
ncbi:chromosome segregation protein SMC [Hymenobacter qilianensis]|uniref:Chromosome segregation protein SMC n=2 Tax=Hymenobacter qilianensis TaxID=1385715 RepID=A0ACB5PX37_9BACT|nr:AAA family ATPase [Hymenobacter qilianensis]QNP54394.1 AAA family ATPase [Hymenobacter qilianensis]GGF80235.1 chromosome segregation protein SMC [Hymenobacter qilianensis]